MNLTSRLMGNLKISFYWRNLINEVMLADFRRWASTEDHAQVPDLILFGGLDYRNLLDRIHSKLCQLL